MTAPADPTADPTTDETLVEAAVPSPPSMVDAREVWTLLERQGGTIRTMAEQVKETHERSIVMEGHMDAVKDESRLTSTLMQRSVDLMELRDQRDQAAEDREEKAATAKIDADEVRAEREAEAETVAAQAKVDAEAATLAAARQAATWRARTIDRLSAFVVDKWKPLAGIALLLLGVNAGDIARALGYFPMSPVVQGVALAPVPAPVVVPVVAPVPAPAESTAPQ